MVTQLDKVLETERGGKATVQVIPFDVGAHAAQDSNFVLFDFDEPLVRRHELGHVLMQAFAAGRQVRTGVVSVAQVPGLVLRPHLVKVRLPALRREIEANIL